MIEFILCFCLEAPLEPWGDFLAPYLRNIAVSAEILSREEAESWFTEHRFPHDLENLRFLLDDCKHYPRLMDLELFGASKEIYDLYGHATIFRDQMRRLSETFPSNPIYESAHEEAVTCVQILGHLYDAYSPGSQPHQKRQALHNYRMAVGATAYYSGFVYPHVPVHRLRIP